MVAAAAVGTAGERDALGMALPPPATIPLLTVAAYAAGGGDPRDLRIACARRRVVRLRRGIYCHAGDWADADLRTRHLLRVRAVLTGIARDHLVAGISAAAVWDLPIPHAWPDQVTLLVRSRPGGTSEPGVRHTMVSARAGLRTATEVDGIPVTSLARTALDLARTMSFPDATAVVDAALAQGRPRVTTPGELLRQRIAAAYVRGDRNLTRVLEFATALSGSPGESRARAMIHQLGFAPPELQVRFADAEGAMLVDFFWRSVQIVGEFDGKVKYSRDVYARGDPAGVLWREKRREDRLRRQVAGVVRIVADDLADPRRLEALLLAAGIPRERPGYVARPQGAPGSFAPQRDQWRTTGRR